jgi:hypothetical protein
MNRGLIGAAGRVRSGRVRRAAGRFLRWGLACCRCSVGNGIGGGGCRRLFISRGQLAERGGGLLVFRFARHRVFRRRRGKRAGGEQQRGREQSAGQSIPFHGLLLKREVMMCAVPQHRPWHTNDERTSSAVMPNGLGNSLRAGPRHSYSTPATLLPPTSMHAEPRRNAAFTKSILSVMRQARQFACAIFGHARFDVA